MPKKKTYNIPTIMPMEGKLPPQDIELEQAVLGAIMLDKDIILDVGDILKPESFYSPDHQKIFSAILDLSSREKPVDLLTVVDQLKKNEELALVGGPAYITQLTNNVASVAHIEYHAKLVAQKYIQRELIRVSADIQKKSFDDNMDVEDLLDESETALFEISEGSLRKEVLHINPILKEAINLIEEAGKNKDKLNGTPSGFTDLDKMTLGWQKSDLVIIAARPSMGKTAFVLSMMRNMAIPYNQPVALFSLEMSNTQLVNRLIVSETQIESTKIKSGNLQSYEWQQLLHKTKQLSEAPIYIDDTPSLSIFELRAKCRRLKLKYDIKSIIIDYLQLMTSSNNSGSREQEVSAISRSLKGLAKELDVPVIALSQLNRSLESRSGIDGKRPQLSDLRESGAIEQDADLVLFIHRPERYGITEDEEGNSTIGIADIIIAKHRNGATGNVKLRFHNEMAKFSNLESDNMSLINGSFHSKMNDEVNVTQTTSFSNNDLTGNSNFEKKDDVPF